MKYLCLIYDDENRWLDAKPEEQQQSFAEHMALMEEAQKNKQWVGGEGLQPVRNTVTLRVRNGKTVQTDGPFTELKEQIGGFYLFDCDNFDQAAALASKIPEARTGTIEIRPVMVYEG
ncbi:MAG: YciI family protein [Myxococcota bacterium]